MSFLIALALQNAVSDPAMPAIRCAAAIRSVEGMDTMQEAVTALYFAMAAARDDGGTPFIERYVEMSKRVGAEVPKMGADGAKVLADCRARWPVAFATGPVVLPADSFQRRMMCMGAAGSMLGVARSLASRNSAAVDLASIETTANRFGGLIGDDEFAQHGMTTAEQVKNAMGDQLKASLRLGNLQVVFNSCEKAFPA